MDVRRFLMVAGMAALVVLRTAPASPFELPPQSQASAPELAAPTPAAYPDPEPIPPTTGVSEPALSLPDLERMALANNPTLTQAAAWIEAAQAQWVQVGLYPNPVAGYVGSEIGNEGRAGQQGGFISQELVTANKLGLNRAAACQEIRQAEFAWQSQRLRVLTDVRRSFYDVLVAQQAVELSEQLVGIGQRGIRSAEELLKAKEVARNDVLQARIEAETANMLLKRAQNRHAAAWRNLAAVVGRHDLAPGRLAGDVREAVADFTWEDSLNKLRSESPQIAGAHAAVARAQANLNRACAGRTPNMELQGSVQYDNATHNTYASVQVGMPVPVFNRNQGTIAKAHAELVAARNDVARLQLELQQRLAAAFEQYTNARYQVEKYRRDILPAAKTSLDLTTAGYQQGELGYLAVLTSQRTYFQANLSYLEALRDLQTASAAIEASLLGDSLQVAERPNQDISER